MEPTIKPIGTAKDFFVYLATVVLLYCSFASLLVLLFNYINYYFPDVLTDSYYYYDPYSSAVRFSLAVLMILFPVYWGMSFYINKDLRANPQKQNMPIRKWLLYLTVFLAAAIVIGDLITLVNTYLNGEITSRFIYKVLTVLVITGFALTYYTLDLKGRYIQNSTLGHIMGGIAVLIVLATIISGFFIIGSPQNQRLMRFDQQKTNDLQNIQYQVLNYWQLKQKIPMTLEEMRDSLSGQTIPLDKQTGKPYVYEVQSGTTFKLCTTFNKESDERLYGGKGEGPARDASFIYPGGMNDNWKHPSGYYCFERTIDSELYPPYPKGIMR